MSFIYICSIIPLILLLSLVTLRNPLKQCSRSMTFWCGSGSRSADPCLCLMNPAIFVLDLQDANKKLNKKNFYLLLFGGTRLRFFLIFCLMTEGSESGDGSRSGSIPLTNGWRPKTCGSGGYGSCGSYCKYLF